MMMKRLMALTVGFCLAGAAAVPAPAAAQPQTVYFYAWGGNPAVNDYLRWAARELKSQDIDLRHVKVADIAEVVKQLTDGQSNADLVWINGENFHALKAAKALYTVGGEVDNLTRVRDDLNWQRDFGEPVEGLEVPWGVGQFYLLSCENCLLGDRVSAEQLLLYAERNPGRISYPKPPEFHGTTFLKALLLSLSENDEVFQQPVDTVEAAALTQPLWRYLERLHPLLWQQGENFPGSASEMRNWFANGALDIAVSFNPNEVETLVQQGRIPATSRRMMLGSAAITNHHYLAVPQSAAAKPAAVKVINFMLSETAQRRKARLDGWGDPAVVRLPQTDTPALLPVAADFHASWQAYLEQEWSERFQ